MALIDEMKKGIVYMYVYKVQRKKKDTTLLGCEYRCDDIGMDSVNVELLMETVLRNSGGRYLFEFRLREEKPNGEDGATKWTTVRSTLIERGNRISVERALTEEELYQKW